MNSLKLAEGNAELIGPLTLRCSIMQSLSNDQKKVNEPNRSESFHGDTLRPFSDLWIRLMSRETLLTGSVVK
jgi:hypothetical protein